MNVKKKKRTKEITIGGDFKIIVKQLSIPGIIKATKGDFGAFSKFKKLSDFADNIVATQGVLAAGIVDWSGYKDEDDREVLFSQEELTELIDAADNKTLYELFALLSPTILFIITKEAEVKNSETTSSE